MTVGLGANQASFLFEIPYTTYNFRVLSFEAVEAISALFQVNVTVGCEDDIDFEEIAGKEAVLTIRSRGGVESGSIRYFHGNICKFKEVGDNDEYYLYRARLVPAIWRLSLEQDCRIFQNTSLQSIIGEILLESGITSDMYKFLLKDEELNCRYCVQYNETDLNFIFRLLEEEGIFFFFEHSSDKHVMVFCDFSFHCLDISGNPSLRQIPSDGRVPDRESITAFNLSKRLRSDAVTTGSFNYKRADLHLSAEQHSGNERLSEIYEYSGTFGNGGRGKKLATIRLEEHASLEEKAKGESGCPRLTPGFTFKFTADGFDRSPVDYLLLAVEHVGDQPQSLDAQGAESTEYWNGFICVPAAVNPRPSRITPKPVIPGMQSAMVTGPPGEEIYPDEFGRVKVRFHWDRKGKNDDKSSCWLRYLQGWGGNGWGMQFIPRVGDEVLVAFLDGDPDRPVIVGSLYNNANMPLYNPLERKTVSSIKTRSYPKGGRDNFHELRFEDRKGNEEIYLQSEKDWNILVKNDKGEIVGHDETRIVKHNRVKTVGADQSETIGNDKTIKVGSNHSEFIGADMELVVGSNKSEEVALNSAESVGFAKELTTGGLYQISVGGVMNETVAGAKTEEVGLAKAVAVGANMTENVIGSRRVTVGTTLEISAGESVLIRCGKSTLLMDSDGNLVINGAKLSFSATDMVKITGKDVEIN